MTLGAERTTAYGLAGLLLLATLGEGGGEPTAMLAWHGWLVALCCLVAMWPRGSASARRTLPAQVLIPFGLFLLLFVLGAMRAPYGYGAVLVSLELGCCVAVAAVAARVGSRALASLVLPLQVGAALQGAWVIVQWFRVDDARSAGTFLNPNHLASWLIAVTLFAAGAARTGDQRSDLARRLALALPAMIAVVLAGSRGAAIGFAVGAGWLVWIRRRSLSRGLRVAIVAAIVSVIGFVGWRQLERIEQHDPFRYQRAKIWSASAGAITEDPWWGSGPGQFQTAAANLAFADGDGPLRHDRAFSVTHSDLLRLPAEFGIPAALAALIAIGLGAGLLVRRGRAGGLPPAADGALAALLAVAAQGLLDNPSSWPSVYLLSSVLAGCLLSSEPRPSFGLPPALRAALVGLLLLVFVIADVGPFAAWHASRRLPAGKLDEAQVLSLDRVLAWNPLDPNHWMRRANHLVSDRTGWGLDAYLRAREAAERAVRLHPRASRQRLGLARLEAHGCRTLFPDVDCRERVAAHYREAERLARYDPLLPVGLAAFLLDTGDAAGARRAAERALAIEPESVLPRLLLADALIEGGSAAGRRRAAELLVDSRERAARWSSWGDGSYGRQLLVPDPRVFERLERKLADAVARTSATR